VLVTDEQNYMWFENRLVGGSWQGAKLPVVLRTCLAEFELGLLCGWRGFELCAIICVHCILLMILLGTNIKQRWSENIQHKAE
jgi:hypothetical protein